MSCGTEQKYFLRKQKISGRRHPRLPDANNLRNGVMEAHQFIPIKNNFLVVFNAFVHKNEWLDVLQQRHNRTDSDALPVDIRRSLRFIHTRHNRRESDCSQSSAAIYCCMASWMRCRFRMESLTGHADDVDISFCLIAGGVLITLSIAGDADANLILTVEGSARAATPRCCSARRSGRLVWRPLVFVACCCSCFRAQSPHRSRQGRWHRC